MIGGPLTNSGSMPINAGAGQANGSLSMGNINMGGSGIDRITLIAIVMALLVGLWLWKKK
ncbi:hypothetical protein ACGRSR_06635 [Vibrio owensii]|uniref:hypothetical protein n=1 Tax=Vibrio owensii TaxID=696485 RepID=UPI003747F9F1